jgi:hypothetical protein
MTKHKYEKRLSTATMIDLSRTTMEEAIVAGFLSLSIILSGCCMTHHEAKENASSELRCMDITGTVLGKLKPDASITLHRIDSSDYDSIMEEINGADQEGMTKVTTSQSFSFHCLPPGLYLLSIPVSSYDVSVGSPIPIESGQRELKVTAILQGGNSMYLFSVFSIERIS